jgi:hypothetical protein
MLHLPVNGCPATPRKDFSPMKSDKSNQSDQDRRTNDFERQAETATPGLAAEFIDFVLHNKKWWLIPIIVVLLMLGLLVLLSGTGAAPFIYTLF